MMKRTLLKYALAISSSGGEWVNLSKVKLQNDLFYDSTLKQRRRQ